MAASEQSTQNVSTSDHYENTSSRDPLFDPSLCSTSHFSTDVATMARQEVLLNQNISDYGCITYSNVIFVPTTRSENETDDVNESIKDEKIDGYNQDMFPCKYLMSSESRVLNTFVRSNDGVENVDNFDGNFGEIMGNSEEIILNEQNQMNIYQNDIDYISENPIRSDSEIILQCSNGQLYRQIQNVYVNPIDGTRSVELIPLHGNNNYEINSNYSYNNHQTEHFGVEQTEIVQTNVSADSIFNEQTKFPSIESINQKSTNDDDMEYQQKQQKDKENVKETTNSSTNDHQQKTLMETMSPLLAAVNITSRDEHYRNYSSDTKLNSTKTDHFNPTKSDESLLHCDNSRTSCTSPIDEYVDINEMEFIKSTDKTDNNILMRRTRRRRTKKTEELTIVDKPVPSRAYASLPNTYLSIGESDSGETVFARKEIPLRTQFGPFEGDFRILNREQLLEYRNNKSNLPLLLLNEQSILDVSNDKTSNWMRFVQKAQTYSEQNLLLLEIDGKLYLKSCKHIGIKHQLRVGYSREYAEKYHLPTFTFDETSIKKKSPDNLTPQKLCVRQNLMKSSTRIKLTPTKNIETEANVIVTPTKKNHRLNTGEIRQKKLALSKNSRTKGPTVRYACCYCTKVFTKSQNYKKHTNLIHSIDEQNKTASNLGDLQASSRRDDIKKLSEKCFRKEEKIIDTSTEEKCVKCEFCSKTVMTPSALTMHMRTHNVKNGGIFRCPFCNENFQNTLLFKDHVQIHMENGKYYCPECRKEFEKYSSVRKHIQLNHSAQHFQCTECDKSFKSRYKLKEHSLRHSNIRQFECECGKQFKRKDKLREHKLRMHTINGNTQNKQQVKSTLSNDNNLQNNQIQCENGNEFELKTIKFTPKVPPTDYQRFIYKCNDCMLGFKRRGMLVNHMAKQHPDISMDSVPELNMPILQTKRCYYCMYCDKEYRSSSKRKAHILKYHPGQELPQSLRHKGNNANNLSPNIDLTYSKNIESIAMDVCRCEWCHKQYASKTRLQQHQRKKHNIELENALLLEKQSHVAYDNRHQFQSAATIYDTHAHLTNGYLREIEPENKLLKLSSAALSCQPFDRECSYKIDEISTTNCDLNQFPQLFDDIN